MVFICRIALVYIRWALMCLDSFLKAVIGLVSLFRVLSCYRRNRPTSAECLTGKTQPPPHGCLVIFVAIFSSLWLEVDTTHPPKIARLVAAKPQWRLKYVRTINDFTGRPRFCHLLSSVHVPGHWGIIMEAFLSQLLLLAELLWDLIFFRIWMCIYI